LSFAKMGAWPRLSTRRIFPPRRFGRSYSAFSPARNSAAPSAARTF